jgi:type I restriction enzyme S subunit
MQSQGFIEQIEMNSGGGALQNVSSVKMLKGIKLPMPEINEQKRIVDVISSMDDGISAIEALIRATKQLRSGLLSDLLSGEHEIPESYDSYIGAAL